MIDTISPEQLANQVLSEMTTSEGNLTFPIDPFKLLKDNNIYILLRNFDRLDGIIINDDENSTIVGINNNRPWPRQRFTAAHEYCHFIKDLKKGVGTRDTIQCLKYSKSAIEKYADSFAAYLLMPTANLKCICQEYLNSEGFIDFKSITLIAEYFGVSFSSCLNRLAYDLKLIDGDISPESLKKRCREYSPAKKRHQLIKNKIDQTILNNMINSLSYSMVNLKDYTGAKFIQNYIYYDNKLEGVEINRDKLNYILADLNYHGINSSFYNNEVPSICMTLGNLELQKYVLTTKEPISIKKCQDLHRLLYKFVPFPDNNGMYRHLDALIGRGTIQPLTYTEIPKAIDNLDMEFQAFLTNISDYNISDYIEKIVHYIYKFIVIHPFMDGNGRLSRALLNWMLKLKNIPPIYIDDNCREEYYNALSEIDKRNNYLPFVMLIEKRIINTMMELHDYLFDEEL